MPMLYPSGRSSASRNREGSGMQKGQVFSIDPEFSGDSAASRAEMQSWVKEDERDLAAYRSGT
jgi:hypothetical protein